MKLKIILTDSESDCFFIQLRFNFFNWCLNVGNSQLYNIRKTSFNGGKVIKIPGIQSIFRFNLNFLYLSFLTIQFCI